MSSTCCVSWVGCRGTLPAATFTRPLSYGHRASALSHLAQQYSPCTLSCLCSLSWPCTSRTCVCRPPRHLVLLCPREHHIGSACHTAWTTSSHHQASQSSQRSTCDASQSKRAGNTDSAHCPVSMALAFLLVHQSCTEQLPKLLPHHHEGRDVRRWVFQWARRIRCVRALIIHVDTCCQPELRFCEHVLELTLPRAHRHM